MISKITHKTPKPWGSTHALSIHTHPLLPLETHTQVHRNLLPGSPGSSNCLRSLEFDLLPVLSSFFCTYIHPQDKYQVHATLCCTQTTLTLHYRSNRPYAVRVLMPQSPLKLIPSYFISSLILHRTSLKPSPHIPKSPADPTNSTGCLPTLIAH